MSTGCSWSEKYPSLKKEQRVRKPFIRYKKNIEDFEVEFENEKIFLMKIMTDFEEKH